VGAASEEGLLPLLTRAASATASDRGSGSVALAPTLESGCAGGGGALATQEGATTATGASAGTIDCAASGDGSGGARDAASRSSTSRLASSSNASKKERQTIACGLPAVCSRSLNSCNPMSFSTSDGHLLTADMAATRQPGRGCLDGRAVPVLSDDAGNRVL